MADPDCIGQTKCCSLCGAEKPATSEFFHPNAGGKYGLRGQCRPCRLAVVRASLKTPEVAAKREAARAADVASGKYAQQKAKWRSANLHKARASSAEWKRRNPAAVKDADRRWRAENRDKVRAKQRRSDARVAQSPIHVLNKRVKSRIRDMLRGNYAPGSIGAHLGFTKAELVAHIERQFTAGMNWPKLLDGEIHIDHIVPVAAFNIMEIGDAEFSACWALCNLRPMWAAENWAKSAKVLTLL